MCMFACHNVTNSLRFWLEFRLLIFASTRVEFVSPARSFDFKHTRWTTRKRKMMFMRRSTPRKTTQRRQFVLRRCKIICTSCHSRAFRKSSFRKGLHAADGRSCVCTPSNCSSLEFQSASRSQYLLRTLIADFLELSNLQASRSLHFTKIPSSSSIHHSTRSQSDRAEKPPPA